jgi:hypothetical protein
MRQLGCRVKENSVGGDGVSKALNVGEPYPETRGIWDRVYLPHESWMGVDLRSVVSDFPVLHPASWVGGYFEVHLFHFPLLYFVLSLAFYGCG